MLYICHMERKVCAYKDYLFYVLDMLKMQERLSTKFVKYVENGIFEIRAEHCGEIFRVFFVFDEGNIVLLFNGFRKKTKKTPREEIEKAIRLINEYYAEKGK